MICVRLPLNNFTLCYIRLVLEMPKYAVAVGRKVGIYDTYDECKQQVIGFPNPKFKKFDRIEDAKEFILKFGKTDNKSSSVTESIAPMVQMRPENVNRPDIIKIEKVSPTSDLFSLTNRVSAIEEKLSKFISDTSNLLENLVSRINDLEGRINCSPSLSEEPPLKKVKTDCDITVGNLITNEEGFVTVYTDGACSKNGKVGATAGIGIWFNDNHPLNISAPVQGPATNNNAEIQAARVAITQAHQAGIRKLKINTDSKFVISCITSWINKWKKNDWVLSTGGPVKNKDELVKLDDAVQLLEAVEWNYVAGHKGIRGNEMADKLAREGARKYNPNVTYSRNAQLNTVKLYSPPDDDSELPF